MWQKGECVEYDSNYEKFTNTKEYIYIYIFSKTSLRWR